MGLDVGTRRIGVSIAGNGLMVARSLPTLEVTENVMQDLHQLVVSENIGIIVVGLPRNLSGDDTDQTRFVRQFAQELSSLTEAKIVFQDEALTSRKAEEFLQQSKKAHQKADIDALSALYILQDYMEEQGL